MPLRKLWNTICGNSDSTRTSTQSAPSPAPTSVGAGRSATPSPRIARESGSEKSGQSPSRVPGKRPVRSKPSSKESKRLIRELKKHSIASVVEIELPNWHASVELAAALAAKVPSLHYVAVDGFDLGRHAVCLKSFHRSLRESGVRASLLPMENEPGLARCARTFGLVDLILWGCERMPTEKEFHSLSRICSPSGLLFLRGSDGWKQASLSDLSTQTQHRAA